MTGRLTNWAGNVAFDAKRLHAPVSVEQLQQLVAGSDRIRALGTGHSFNRIADSPGELVSLAGLPRDLRIDGERATVTIGAGLRYGELVTHLDEKGFALHNLGSLPHISVAGACATGTHGSGDRNRNLATAVSAMELVTADGELLALSRAEDGDRFLGAVVGLGALGIVTSLTLDLEPAFSVRQYVYEGLPREQLTGNFAEIFSAAYSVSVFTDWRRPHGQQVWLKQRLDRHDGHEPEPRWLGASLADGPRHPVPGMPAVNCTPQMGVPGPWHERLPHFRLEFTPSSGDELQSEYFVPREAAVAAVGSLFRMGDRLAPALQISEIRTIAADELWLSPCHRRDTVAFHFTWTSDMRVVAPAVAAVEEQLSPLGARPHWGKVFSVAPEAVAGLYERLPEFRRLLRRYDPGGKFRNDLLDRYIPAGDG